MDFNATVDLIIKDLKEAGEIIEDLKNYPGVPAIQAELAKSKCRSAASVIALLKNLHEADSSHEKKESLPVPEKAEDISPPVSFIQEEPVLPTRKASESSIFADTFSNSTSRVNERLGTHSDENSRSGMMKTKHLSDLTDAIGINDKFLFIREIFNGNTESYFQAISKLNKVDNITDAEVIISGYAGNNKENVASKQLLDLVKRKFHSDE